jgi:hypothetical protein
MAHQLPGVASLGGWVLNDVGQPIPEINVRLVYQNYSAEGRSHEVTLRADENGYVLFPPNYETASLFQRVLYTMSSATGGVHASFGRYAHVFAFRGGSHGFPATGDYVADWQGKPDAVQSRIIARRNSSEF